MNLPTRMSLGMWEEDRAHARNLLSHRESLHIGNAEDQEHTWFTDAIRQNHYILYHPYNRHVNITIVNWILLASVNSTSGFIPKPTIPSFSMSTPLGWITILKSYLTLSWTSNSMSFPLKCCLLPTPLKSPWPALVWGTSAANFCRNTRCCVSFITSEFPNALLATFTLS